MKARPRTTTCSATEPGDRDGRGRRLVHGLILLAAGSIAQAAESGRPPAFRPTQPETVLMTFSPAVRAASASRQRPMRIDDVRALIELAVRDDDARLLGHAEARLRTLREQPERKTEATFLIAWIAQHRHDFAAATTLLDDVLAQDPRHVGALRTRTFVMHALGEVAPLRRHCVALALLGDGDYATLCSALWLYANGQLDAAIEQLTPLIASSSDALLRDEARRVVAEIELARARPEAVLAAIDAMRARRPGDLRQRVRADVASGSCAALVPESDGSDEALYLRARAATCAGGSDAAQHRAAFLVRLHEREQAGDSGSFGLAAEYFLDVAPDSQRARDYARRLLLTTREPRALALARRAGVDT